MINKEVSDFSVQAYQNGEFKTVTKADILENGAYFSSIRPTLPLYALPSWRICRINILISRLLAAKSTLFLQTPILSTKHGMIPLKESVRSLIQCWQILPTHSARILKC